MLQQSIFEQILAQSIFEQMLEQSIVEQMLEQSIFAVLAPFLSSHLPYIIDHHYYTASCHFPTEWLRRPQYSRKPMTLGECQGHSHWYQNVDQSCLPSFQMWKESIDKCGNASQPNVLCKITKVEFSLCNIKSCDQSVAWVRISHWPWQRVKFHPNRLKNLRENKCRSFWFLSRLWPWKKVKAVQMGVK